MTAAPVLRAAGGGEAIPAARAIPCECCELPVESCGVAYAQRAGVDLRSVDQHVAAEQASPKVHGLGKGCHGTPALDDARVAPWLRGTSHDDTEQDAA